jgi:hypothetical protein
MTDSMDYLLSNYKGKIYGICTSTFSTKVHNGGRTFFVDVKSAKRINLILKITESSISKEGEKKKAT